MKVSVVITETALLCLLLNSAVGARCCSEAAPKHVCIAALLLVANVGETHLQCLTQQHAMVLR